jgi:hypothetical protein
VNICSVFLPFFLTHQPKHKKHSLFFCFFHFRTAANCEPLGNLLIIQNEKMSVKVPNDSAFGGCFLIRFTSPVSSINFGILDIDDRSNVTLSVRSKSILGMDRRVQDVSHNVVCSLGNSFFSDSFFRL